MGVLTNKMKSFCDCDLKDVTVWEVVEVSNVVRRCTISHVVTKLMVCGVFSVGRDVMKVVEVVCIGERSMCDGAIHVVLIIPAVSLE